MEDKSLEDLKKLRTQMLREKHLQEQQQHLALAEQQRQALAEQNSTPETSTAGNALEIIIEVPENTSPEELREIVKQAALHADSVHRANGGDGLKVDRLNIFEESHVPQGVK